MILTGQRLEEVASSVLTPTPPRIDPISVDIHIGHKLNIMPNSFDTVAAYEKFNMPNDVAALLTGRSTHMRQGLNTPMGWIDPGKSGEVMLEYFNMSNEMKRLNTGEPAARLVFFQLIAETKPYDGKWSQ